MWAASGRGQAPANLGAAFPEKESS